MKTIEEKAKAYDEALERAKKLLITEVAADIFPELKDVENKTLNNDDHAFLRDCARVLKTYGWQSYADRLISLCPTVGEEVKDMISTPIIPKESEDERIRKEIIVFLKSDARTQVIPTKQYELWLTWLEKQGEQKPAWGEEDEKILKDTIRFCELYGNQVSANWLKSLKDRVQPQPKQEWSEDGWTMQDEEELDIAIKTLEEAGQYSSANWLKNVCLVPRPKQEWSEEEEENFKKAIKILKVNNFHHTADMLQEMKYKLIPMEETNKWKPSEGQINVCKEVYADILSTEGFDIGTINSELNRLEEELKKLKG